MKFGTVILCGFTKKKKMKKKIQSGSYTDDDVKIISIFVQNYAKKYMLKWDYF